jgi:hypothetical protein
MLTQSEVLWPHCGKWACAGETDSKGAEWCKVPFQYRSVLMKFCARMRHLCVLVQLVLVCHLNRSHGAVLTDSIAAITSFVIQNRAPASVVFTCWNQAGKMLCLSTKRKCSAVTLVPVENTVNSEALSHGGQLRTHAVYTSREFVEDGTRCKHCWRSSTWTLQWLSH